MNPPRLDGGFKSTWCLIQAHKFSMGLRSGLQAGHSMQIIPLTSATLEVCFGSLSSWKIHPSGYNVSACVTKHSLRMFVYTSPVRFSLKTDNGKVPRAENAPQACTFGLCLFLGLTASWLPLHHNHILPPASQIDISSLKTTHSQSVCLLLRAHETLCCLCLSVSMGIFLTTLCRYSLLSSSFPRSRGIHYSLEVDWIALLIFV